MITNIRLDRKINKNESKDNEIGTFLYQQTFDHYLRILEVVMQNQIPVKEKHFYYSPNGELLLAEKELNSDERIIFLYEEDNPVIYSKSDWNPKEKQYIEVDFGTMNKIEDGKAQQLL